MTTRKPLRPAGIRNPVITDFGKKFDFFNPSVCPLGDDTRLVQIVTSCSGVDFFRLSPKLQYHHVDVVLELLNSMKFLQYVIVEVTQENLAASTKLLEGLSAKYTPAVVKIEVDAPVVVEIIGSNPFNVLNVTVNSKSVHQWKKLLLSEAKSHGIQTVATIRPIIPYVTPVKDVIELFLSMKNFLNHVVLDFAKFSCRSVGEEFSCCLDYVVPSKVLSFEGDVALSREEYKLRFLDIFRLFSGKVTLHVCGGVTGSNCQGMTCSQSWKGSVGVFSAHKDESKQKAQKQEISKILKELNDSL